MRIANPHLRQSLAGSVASWQAGAAAAGGPLTVLLFVFGTALTAVGLVRLFVGATIFGWPTVAWAAAVTALVGPWFVTRGWLRRDRG
jgi:hypothetical protein